VTALSLIGLTPPPGQLNGSVRFKNRELVGLSERDLTRVRGSEVGLILQDATAAMDPLKTVGAHIEESLRMHTDISASDARDRALGLVRQVRISDPELRVQQYSHELSGGMAQRAVTASVIGLQPDLLIADEPTSALDATTADGVLDLLRELGRDQGMAVLLITHDLGIVARFAERVIVMYAGRIVEEGSVGDIFAHPRHPYTKGLLASMPGSRGRHSVQAIPAGSPDRVAPAGCAFQSRCSHSNGRAKCLEQRPELLHRAGPETQLSACHFADELTALEPLSADFGAASIIEDVEILRVDNLRKDFSVKSNLLGHGGEVTAVDGASFRIRRGEVLGLVGESGSGKSTTGKLILGLEAPTAGQLQFDGIDISTRVERRPKDLQRRIQVVFQNPNSSLDPRMRVGEIISEPLDVHRIGSRAERKARVAELLEQVGLESAHADRYPFEFSGGQRQRIAIARALAPRPDFIICDEPLTALDVSVQAQILNLLQEIQLRDRLSYLFIAHDLAVVRQIADRVAVMYLGHIVETGSAEEFFESPHHPYSMALLSAMSTADPVVEQTRERIILRGPVPSPLNPPSGCAFHTRCWKVQDLCRTVAPAVLEISKERTVACHFPENVESGVVVRRAVRA
jgi:peptide/nickel transport system ATP-binding protein